MSLINDALRRARQAQQAAPPPAPSNLQFRPVDPAQYPRHRLGLMLPLALGVVGLLVLFFVWQLSPWNSPGQSAGPKPQSAVAQTPAPAAAPAPELAAAQPPGAPAPGPAPTVAAENQPAPPASQASAAPLTRLTESNAVTNSALAAEPLPPKPAPLKLQGIVFRPTRPSAVINGKILFIGDRLGEFRLAAIGQDSATLISLTRTNVLTLP